MNITEKGTEFIRPFDYFLTAHCILRYHQRLLRLCRQQIYEYWHLYYKKWLEMKDTFKSTPLSKN